MRPCVIITIFMCLTFQAFSQNEMDTRCMKRIKEFSSDIQFSKFSGQTIVSKDTIKFDSSIIIIRGADPELIKIFELGIIFPDLIFGASTQGDKYQITKSLTADTLTISDVSELRFKNQELSTKSFSFLLWNKNMANPSLYLFELTNKNANRDTSIKTFIEKAKITAFGFCSILI